jgi:hypothetical protein
LVDLKDDSVRVEALSFSPKRAGRPAVRRSLIAARRSGPKWNVEPVTFGASEFRVRVASDEAHYTLKVAASSSQRWDFSCQRLVAVKAGATLRRYADFVHALAPLANSARPRRRPYRRVDLSLDEPVVYELTDALCRTLSEAERRYERGTAFEWVGLLCRHGAENASLRLSAPVSEWLRPFASVTDLTTGRERPAKLEERDGSFVLSVPNCAPRTMLRIYWPLR